jgi:5-methylcytosine-specific restriction enzyme subunit McrC
MAWRKAPGQFVPVDAKYKLYDEKHVSPGDIYQMFLYALAYGQHHAVLPTALLLYPASSNGTGRVRLHVRHTAGASSAEVRGVSVDIPAALAEAKRGECGPIGREIIGILTAITSQALSP